MNPEPATRIHSAGVYSDYFPEKGVLENDRLIIQSGTYIKILRLSNYKDKSEYYSDLIAHILEGYYLVNGRIPKIIARYYAVIENPS